MSQVDATGKQDELAILRDMLHIIASTPSLDQCVDGVLANGRILTGATGAALVLFDDTQAVYVSNMSVDDVPAYDLLSDWVDERWSHELRLEGQPLNRPLPPALTPDVPAWVLAPIVAQHQIIGVLWMIFDAPQTQLTPNFNVLLDGVTVVAVNIRSTNRHKKIILNQNEFIRIVSHDMRSPLTSVQGFASMLESGMVGELNEKQTHFVEKILSGISQMTSLVDNIQDAGRYDPESGFYEMTRTHCDIIGIVDRIMSNHLVPADKPALTVSSDIADDIPVINADVDMLERAITNLVDNAIKYTPDGGKILVGVRRHNDRIIVKVQDNGLGISEDHQKLLFERHRRIPREEHKRIKGSGLGLFIVRSVARRHGGDAWVESVEGEGSSFYISVPILGANALMAD